MPVRGVVGRLPGAGKRATTLGRSQATIRCRAGRCKGRAGSRRTQTYRSHVSIRGAGRRVCRNRRGGCAGCGVTVANRRTRRAPRSHRRQPLPPKVQAAASRTADRGPVPPQGVQSVLRVQPGCPVALRLRGARRDRARPRGRRRPGSLAVNGPGPRQPAGQVSQTPSRTSTPRTGSPGRGRSGCTAGDAGWVRPSGAATPRARPRSASTASRGSPRPR
jgi:hypothetical protein